MTSMLVTYATLIGGLALLVFAGDLLVRGAVGLAENLGIPALVIGLTIVAFGTSAPELLIALEAAEEGAPGIAIGNVVGSNIANILLVLGLPAIITATHCSQSGTLRSALFMIAISLVFIGLAFTGSLGRFDALILLMLLLYFLYDSVRTAKRLRAAGKADPCMEEIEDVPHNWLPIAGFLGAGLIGLPLGANLTIDAAVAIAKNWGVSEAAIGLTVVALGTSLPELATTLMAAFRGQAAVALGNVIGSNVFNLLAILGITGIFYPLAVPEEIIKYDVWMMLAASALLVPFIFFKWRITRPVGMTFVTLYILYLYVVFKG